YRGEWEFFRFTPKDKESVKIFPVEGIHVKSKESQPTKIVLENVPREISGPFSCEVTAEMPSFYTLMQTAELQVVEVPRTAPYITGIKKRYSLEDEIFRANCTSEHSYPAANITWYINGHQSKKQQILSRSIDKTDNSVTVTSSIRHHLPKKAFQNKRMRVQCLTNIYNVYYYTAQVTVELIDKRSKSHQQEWPPTTGAPPSLSRDSFYDSRYYESSIEPPLETTLWFWPSSSAAHLRMFTMPMTLLVIGYIALFR
ncbi:hypothetical protein D910_11421, partial [Dendroctonus ponderosae]